MSELLQKGLDPCCWGFLAITAVVVLVWIAVSGERIVNALDRRNKIEEAKFPTKKNK